MSAFLGFYAAKAKRVTKGILIILACTILTGCKPVITFTALQSTIVTGTSTDLDWDVEFAQGSGGNLVEISPDIGEVELEGKVTVTPDETTTYTLKTRSFVYGFPMFISKEVTVEVEDGDFWDFSDTSSAGLVDWSFEEAGFPADDEDKFNFVSGLVGSDSDLGEAAAQLSVAHEDGDEDTTTVGLYAWVQKTGLEDNTDYQVLVTVKYFSNEYVNLSGERCDNPVVPLNAYVASEEPEIEDDDSDDNIRTVLNLNESSIRLLAADLELIDGDNDCEDLDGGAYDVNTASTEDNPITFTSDSDGSIWLVLEVSPSFPEFTMFISSITAIFTEVE